VEVSGLNPDKVTKERKFTSFGELFLFPVTSELPELIMVSVPKKFMAK
jgi:hypothetical protein